MKFIIALVLLAVGLGGFFYYLLIEGPSSMTQSEEMVLPDDVVELLELNEEQAGVSSLKDLLAFESSVECAISYRPYEAANEITGTYFVHAGKARGDFLTESPDLTGQILTSLILESDKLYVWSDIADSSYGVQVGVVDGVPVAEAREPIPLAADVRYNCTSWTTIDQTLFTPPAEVLFQAPATFREPGMEYGTIYESEDS